MVLPLPATNTMAEPPATHLTAHDACEGSAPLAPHFSSLTQPSHLPAVAGVEVRPLATQIDARATTESATNASFFIGIISSLDFLNSRSESAHLFYLTRNWLVSRNFEPNQSMSFLARRQGRTSPS